MKTLNFGGGALLCAAVGTARLLCAAVCTARLLCAAVGTARLLCAAVGTARLLCAAVGTARHQHWLQAGAHPEFFSGGEGVLTLRLYISCFMLKVTLHKCHKHNTTVYNYIYIHIYITTCSITQSQCPILLFFLILLIYFSKFYCTVIS
jgi:hypothetical protein